MAAQAGFRLGDLSWGIIGMNYLHGEMVTGGSGHREDGHREDGHREDGNWGGW